MSDATTAPIWLFDSACVLCSWGVQHTLRYEKAETIRFVAIQSTEGRALALRHGVDPDDPATFLFVENGAALEKSDAVIALSRHLKGLSGALPLKWFLPKRLRDAAYSWIARNRYRIFGKTQVCLMPTARPQPPPAPPTDPGR